MNVKQYDKIETVFAAPLDFMSKRKLNTAPNTAPNITLDDIELNGLTLEAMANINVPVYKYRTQVTIHGLWPETQGYCFGYKNLVKNKNGSFGVRYAAIDGRKKRAIRNISRLSSFHPNHDSQGTTFTRGYKSDLAQLKVDFALITSYKHLFIGSVDVLRCQLSGRYYLQISLKAIPKKNFWAFCENVLGIAKVDYKTLAIAELAKDRAYQAKCKADRERREAETKELRRIAIANLENFGLKSFSPNGSPFRGIRPSCNVSYIDDKPESKYMLYETKRKGPNICIMGAKFPDIQSAVDHKFDWSKKARKYQHKINKLWI